MMYKSKDVRNYYRKDGYVFVADHVIKTVDIPHGYDEDDYKNCPEPIIDLIKKSKYNVQLTIK